MTQERNHFASEARGLIFGFRATLRETWPGLISVFIAVTLALVGVGIGWLIGSFVETGSLLGERPVL